MEFNIRLRCSCGSEDIKHVLVTDGDGKVTTRVRCQACGFERDAPPASDAIKAGFKLVDQLFPKSRKKIR